MCVQRGAGETRRQRASLDKFAIRRGGVGERAAVGIDVRLTDQTLSCTARALVTEARAARGAPACEARECAPRDAVLFLTFRSGSAAGPKPGRASFCGELGRSGTACNLTLRR